MLNCGFCLSGLYSRKAFIHFCSHYNAFVNITMHSCFKLHKVFEIEACFYKGGYSIIVPRCGFI